jgi:hypothetical protein
VSAKSISIDFADAIRYLRSAVISGLPEVPERPFVFAVFTTSDHTYDLASTALSA